jgi:hypothetical protein
MGPFGPPQTRTHGLVPVSRVPAFFILPFCLIRSTSASILSTSGPRILCFFNVLSRSDFDRSEYRASGDDGPETAIGDDGPETAIGDDGPEATRPEMMAVWVSGAMSRRAVFRRYP